MFKRALVKELIEEGRRLVDALEKKRGFGLAAALWLYLPDVERWRLVIASEIVERKGSINAYANVQRELSRLRLRLLSLNDISVTGPGGPEFRDVKDAVGSAVTARAGRGGTRDVIHEDAYIYRWTPHAA
jgi:hypothetical protein